MASDCLCFRSGIALKTGREVRPRDDWPDSSAWTRQGTERGNELSKTDDYLVDNLFACMLSEVKAGGQEQSGAGLLIRFRFGIVAPTLFAQNAKKGGAPRVLAEWSQERVGQPPRGVFTFE